MEISPLLVYFWGQADAIRNFLAVLAAICCILTFLTIIFPAIINDKIIIKWQVFVWAFLSLSFAILSTFCPTSKTVALMYVLPEISKSKMVQEDLPEIYNMAIESLKENLKK